jgi:hypothetical protein
MLTTVSSLKLDISEHGNGFLLEKTFLRERPQ